MLTPRDPLLTGHDEFQRLVQEHSQYSQRLESLTEKRYLTDDEKLAPWMEGKCSVAQLQRENMADYDRDSPWRSSQVQTDLT